MSFVNIDKFWTEIVASVQLAWYNFLMMSVMNRARMMED